LALCKIAARPRAGFAASAPSLEREVQKAIPVAAQVVNAVLPTHSITRQHTQKYNGVQPIILLLSTPAPPLSHRRNTALPTTPARERRKNSPHTTHPIIFRRTLAVCPPALCKIIGTCSDSQGIYVIICLSLRSNRQSLSRQQGIYLI